MAEMIIDVAAAEPRRIWCDRCETTAGIEVDLFVLTPTGLTPVGTATQCTRCDDQGEDDTT